MAQNDQALLTRLKDSGLDFVMKQSVVAHFSYGEFRFLNLDALVASKKAVGRERDLAALRYLLAIRERNEQLGEWA
jgi:hypothetical protein